MAGILAAIICSAAGFILHLAVFSIGIVKVNKEFRLRKLVVLLRSALIIWLLFSPLLVKLFFSQRINNLLISLNSELFLFVYGIAFFLMLFFLYLTFYYVVDRSVSSRIMIEINNSNEKALNEKEIKELYDAKTKYKNELEGMCQGGFLIKQGPYYINTAKGSIWGKIALWYKNCFRLGEGG